MAINKINNLSRLSVEYSVLIASHRGVSGGHIVQNTILAYDNALSHGANIIEIDVIKSTDGVFYTFHDGIEDTLLGIKESIKDLSSKEIDELRIRNESGEDTNYKLEKLWDVLDHYKDNKNVLINIDRSWFYWEEIIELINTTSMLDQIILKSPPKSNLLKELSLSGPNIMYMPIVNFKEDIILVESFEINTVAVEIIFKELDSNLIKASYLKELKNKGYIIWVNAITLNDTIVLSAKLDDNNSIMTGNYDQYWGRLINLGFDIIQTDWPALIKNYIIEKNREKK